MTAQTDASQLSPLIDAGYQLLPLHHYTYEDEYKGKRRKRGKSPVDNAWMKKVYRSDLQVQYMEEGYNVGVRLRSDELVLDIDPRAFPDGQTLSSSVNPYVELVLWTGINPDLYPTVETGSGGLHIYMAKPANVSTRDSLNDQYPGIEFKSFGRQVVSAGSIHPDTGRTYLWKANTPKLDGLGADAAPDALIDLIRRPVGSVASGGGEYDQEELATMLEHLDPEAFSAHDDWLTIMQACHHATAGDGRQEFIDWCTQDPAYADHGGLIGLRWDSLHADADGVRVTFRTLHKFLRDAGEGEAIPRPPAADDFDDLEPDDVPDDIKASSNTAANGPLACLNDKYAAVNLEGKFRVAYQSTDIDPEDNRERTKWCFSSKASFEDLHMNRRLRTPDGKSKPLGKAWLEWGGREQADGVVFDPSSTEKIVKGRLNLWTGFSCKPVEGDWSSILWLIGEALCAGDKSASEYVLDWVAWKIQNPDLLPGVALAFKGAKGTGKTTLGDLIASLFGSHGLVLSQRDQLTGKFNAYLGTACFVLCDEVDFRHAAGREDSQLKKLVTDRASMIERKGIDATASTNRLGVMLATNADVVVPASADERRYAVFEVLDTWATGDRAPNRAEAINRHDAVHAQIKNGGREAFLYAMLNRQVENHPRVSIPATAALAGQKVESLQLIQRWWLSVCEEGELPQPFEFKAENEFPDVDNENAAEADWEEAEQFTTYAEIAEAITRFAKDEGVRHKRPTARAILNDLKPFGVRGGKKHKQQRAWGVPSLVDVRLAWTEYLGSDPF
ncbi:DUF5906 domain-containing protein [Rhodobacteraceae bacterium]|nr:DUF5906 domain-containing protein [Paracoccaceae bacterium]